ncbi:hypothetical protein AAC387_Pa07g2299 [Persea americana]
MDDAGDMWEEGGEDLLEVGLEKFGGMNEREEEGHGGKLVCAFYSKMEIWRALRERKLEDCGCGVGERGANERRICRWGEDGDDDVAVVEEVGKMEERDGVAFDMKGRSTTWVVEGAESAAAISMEVRGEVLIFPEDDQKK